MGSGLKKRKKGWVVEGGGRKREESGRAEGRGQLA
jgi:hypothetical protein